MASRQVIAEFRAVWLPNFSDAGLHHITNLLEKSSPYLVHGAFARCPAQGCLATHAAWHHPRTASLGDEAGVIWLAKVAGLNPATSHVILAWDAAGRDDFALRTALLRACRAEQDRRMLLDPVTA